MCSRHSDKRGSLRLVACIFLQLYPDTWQVSPAFETRSPFLVGDQSIHTLGTCNLTPARESLTDRAASCIAGTSQRPDVCS